MMLTYSAVWIPNVHNHIPSLRHQSLWGWDGKYLKRVAWCCFPRELSKKKNPHTTKWTLIFHWATYKFVSCLYEYLCSCCKCDSVPPPKQLAAARCDGSCRSCVWWAGSAGLGRHPGGPPSTGGLSAQGSASTSGSLSLQHSATSSTRKTTSFEKHLSLWQIISAGGLQGGKEVQAPYFIFSVTAASVCAELYFIRNAMHAHTDNWHFKGITLDRATRTNESKRQNDLSGGRRNILIYIFLVCAVWNESPGRRPGVSRWPGLR